MNIVDPDTLRLVPGQSMEALFSAMPDGPVQVGFFIRSLSGLKRTNGDLDVRQRGGVIRHNNVLLVLTMLRIQGSTEELFDVWWDYHSKGGLERFRHMAEQESITLHFYADNGRDFTVDIENTLKRFFDQILSSVEELPPWNEVEFDRAVRSFCAQSYPKENLWDLIELRAPGESSAEEARSVGIDDYPGEIPGELRPFYVYLPDKGHCIRIIPSLMEAEVSDADPEDFLHPAPVKTVLRCGLRWVKGYPVAPIPFIPGHGLAVPPDDAEF